LADPTRGCPRGRAYARGRRFPLLTRAGQVTTAVVHIQIDPHRPLLWTPALRADAARAAVQLADAPGVTRVQIDFEVPASQRQVLLDRLTDVRAGLPPSTPLSMTALASWCEREDWRATRRRCIGWCMRATSAQP